MPGAALPVVDPRTEPALADYALLDESGTFDASHDPDFDRLIRLAKILCGTSMAFVSFVGESEQWIKARDGLDLERSSRQDSLCMFTMAQPDTFVIADTLNDPRSSTNRFVTGDPFIRFYVGVPLRSPEGVAVGAFCIADPSPRDGLTDEQRFGLETLARQVMLILESRRRARWRKRTEAALATSHGAGDFVGFWDWDVSIDPLAKPRAVNDGSIVLPPLASQNDIARILERIHTADREPVASAILSSLATGEELRVEYRLPPRDGAAERWMLARGRPIRDGEVNRRFPGVVVEITSRTRAEAERVASEAKFSTIADTMPQMVWSTSADGNVDYFNSRWYEFTGVTPGAHMGQAWIDVIHPDDRARTTDVWDRAIATGEPYDIEYRLRHHSGQYRWALGRALPVRDSADRILRWFGTCTDIHEQKNAAEERELVAQELSHRIKNTFLVISGLIGLYARTDPAMRPFADAIRDRILALGRAHNFVRPHSRRSAPETAAVTAHRLFAELFAPYRFDESVRIRVSGDDLDIGDRAATPLALLFHELATNAVKYGALSTAEGQVTLATTREGDLYRLEWMERGGPPVEQPSGLEGFGTRLSRLSVEAQLGGSIERHWDRDGLRVITGIPVGAIAPRDNVRQSLDPAPA